MGFRLHLRDLGSKCRRCKKRNACVNLEVTSREHRERQWVELCQGCFDSVAHSVARFKFCRENPEHSSVTDGERAIYGIGVE